MPADGCLNIAHDAESKYISSHILSYLSLRGGFSGGCFSLNSVHMFYCMNYNDSLRYCLPHKCIIVVQHLVFHTSKEKLSAALKRKSTLKQNVHMFLP